VLLTQGVIFVPLLVEESQFVSLGTPTDVKKFQESFAYVFDLDGALVRTDHLFVKVWRTLLEPWQQDVDAKFYDQFIKGRHDHHFVIDLVPEIKAEALTELSHRKNELLVQLLGEVDAESLLVGGVLGLLETLRNNKVAVVTSYSRAVATVIMERAGLHKFVQFLVLSEGSLVDPKPSGLYIQAMQHFVIPKERCIVLTGSMFGYRIAHATGVFRVMMCSSSPEATLHSKGVTLNTFHAFDPNQPNDVRDQKANVVQRALAYMGVKEVTFAETKLKAGYICYYRASNGHSPRLFQATVGHQDEQLREPLVGDCARAKHVRKRGGLLREVLFPRGSCPQSALVARKYQGA
jgi:beta-phosphoglucomutase-like phosphatase (HAD superfamily)